MTECTEYGPKIQNAINAVGKMHKDTSLLLGQCDNTIGKGKESLFGGSATRGISRACNAEMWMAEGVYRFYYEHRRPAHVEGVTAAFTEFSEPLFIVGQYDRTETNKGDFVEEWALWNGFFEWHEGQKLNKVINLSQRDIDAPHINNMQLIAVPLYSINKPECVQDLLNRVKSESKTSA